MSDLRLPPLTSVGESVLTLDAPREGEPWQAAGQRAGEALWAMLRAVVSREMA